MTSDLAPGEPFAPEDQPWTRVSPRLATLRRAIHALADLVVTVIASGLAALVSWQLSALVAVLGVVGAAWGWVVVGRAVRSWGYAERADDLMVTRGILFRQLVVVPYGRIQFVDVTAGPLDRRFNLATVQLHTAAAATDAQIPGLEPMEAARLRDRLAARGEAGLAGI